MTWNRQTLKAQTFSGKLSTQSMFSKFLPPHFQLGSINYRTSHCVQKFYQHKHARENKLPATRTWLWEAYLWYFWMVRILLLPGSVAESVIILYKCTSTYQCKKESKKYIRHQQLLPRTIPLQQKEMRKGTPQKVPSTSPTSLFARSLMRHQWG